MQKYNRVFVIFKRNINPIKGFCYLIEQNKAIFPEIENVLFSSNCKNLILMIQIVSDHYTTLLVQ